MKNPASNSARSRAKRRLASGLIGVIAALALAGAAHADNKKPASGNDGHYFDADGNPTYNIGDDGKVDWATHSGFRRYHSECHVCHGPDGMGSSYAPALVDSLKTMTYATFLETVAAGRQNLSAGNEKVMPSFGTNKNVMCYLDDIYVYLRARADGALGRTRPDDNEPKPQSSKDAEASCLGPQ